MTEDKGVDQELLIYEARKIEAVLLRELSNRTRFGVADIMRTYRRCANLSELLLVMAFADLAGYIGLQTAYIAYRVSKEASGNPPYVIPEERDGSFLND